MVEQIDDLTRAYEARMQRSEEETASAELPEDIDESARILEKEEEINAERRALEKRNKREKILKILAFILTLVLVPLLFVGTCVPLGMFAYDHAFFDFFWIIYPIVFLAIVAWRAYRTQNQSVRAALIIILGLGCLAVFWLVIMPSFRWFH